MSVPELSPTEPQPPLATSPHAQLDHPRLSPPEESKPRPVAAEVMRVPPDEEGREIEAP